MRRLTGIFSGSPAAKFPPFFMVLLTNLFKPVRTGTCCRGDDPLLPLWHSCTRPIPAAYQQYRASRMGCRQPTPVNCRQTRVDIQVVPPPTVPPEITIIPFLMIRQARNSLIIPGTICRGSGGNVPVELRGVFAGTPYQPPLRSPQQSRSALESP